VHRAPGRGRDVRLHGGDHVPLTLSRDKAMAKLLAFARILRRPVTGPEAPDCRCRWCIEIRAQIVYYALAAVEAEEREGEWFAGGVGAGSASSPPRGVHPAPPAFDRRGA